MAVEEGGAKVLIAIEGAPAAKGGALAGDVITHVGGEALAGLTLNQMIAKLRGPVGSPARLQLRRKDHPMPLDIAVVREANKAIVNVRAEEAKLVVRRSAVAISSSSKRESPSRLCPCRTGRSTSTADTTRRSRSRKVLQEGSLARR